MDSGARGARGSLVEEVCQLLQGEAASLEARVGDFLREHCRRQQELVVRCLASTSVQPCGQHRGCTECFPASPKRATTATSEDTWCTGGLSDTPTQERRVAGEAKFRAWPCRPQQEEHRRDVVDFADVHEALRRVEGIMKRQEQADAWRRKQLEDLGSAVLTRSRSARPSKILVDGDALAPDWSVPMPSPGFPKSPNGPPKSPTSLQHSPTKEFFRAANPRMSELMESARSYASRSWVPRQWLDQHMEKWVARWDRLAASEHTDGRLARFVLSRYFESTCVFVIIANTAFTWYSTNYEIKHLDEGATPFIVHVDQAFVCFYTIELMLKLVVFRLSFFFNSDMRWNMFDTILVAFSLTDLVTTLSSPASQSSSNVTFMRVLRILKMAKLLRGLRVMRFFSELRLMLNSLVGSLASLMWSIIMLLLIFYVFGLIFVQGAAMHLYLHKETMASDDMSSIYAEFGSVEAAMLTLYRSCTGGEDWSHFYHVAALTGTMYGALFIFFIAFSHIAFMNILTAIFVNKAMELAKPDKDAVAREQRAKDIEAYEELRTLCSGLDTSGTGVITAQGFERHIRTDSRLAARLAILGLNVADAEHFFDILLFATGGSAGRVTVDDFVEGCMRMRGAASGVDLHMLDKRMGLIYKSMSSFQKETRTTLATLVGVLGSTPIPEPEGLSLGDVQLQHLCL